MNHVFDVSDATFMTEVIERSRSVPVVVDFWAEWCEPCKSLGPTLERLAEEFDGAFLLAKAHADRTAQVASALRVQSIPAVFIFRDGQPVDAFVGALAESEIRQFLAPHVASEADAIATAASGLGAGEDAESAYRTALEADPKQPAALLGMARILARRGETEGARAYLDRVPGDSAEVRAAERLGAALDFWSFGAGLDGAPPAMEDAEPCEDLDARLLEAARAARRGEDERALALLYEVVGERREYRDEMARRAMLSLFGFIGEDSVAVRTWQRRLANLLY